MSKNSTFTEGVEGIDNLNKALEHEEVKQSSISYDEVFKNIARYKCMAAVLIKYTIREYENLGIEEIAKLIVDTRPRGPQSTTELLEDEIDLLPTVTGTGLEKVTLQDVVFAVESIVDRKLYNTVTVNFEMQRKNTNEPHIVPRAMYYGASLLRDTVPAGDTKYVGLHKVYTVWFCEENIFISNRDEISNKCEVSIRPYIYKHRYNMYRHIDEMPEYSVTGEEEADLIEVVIIELKRLENKVKKCTNVSEKDRLLFKAFNNLPDIVNMVEETCHLDLKNFKREAIKMVDWDKLTEQKVEEGREEGRVEARLTSIMSLMKTLKWSAKQAMNALSIPEEEQHKYIDLLTNKL